MSVPTNRTVLRVPNAFVRWLLLAVVVAGVSWNPLSAATDADADFRAAVAAYEREEYETALATLRPLAEGGHAQAQALLGFMLVSGTGVEGDPDEGLRLVRAAAEQNVPGALFLLGTLYREGIAVAQDDAEAFKWTRAAAEGGVPMAQRYLGIAYMEGRGTSKDLVRAMAWITLAAVADDEEALALLEQLRPRLKKKQMKAAKKLVRELLTDVIASDEPSTAEQLKGDHPFLEAWSPDESWTDLETELVNETELESGPVRNYHIRVDGLRSGEQCQLHLSRLDGTVTPFPVAPDEEGILRFGDTDGPPFELALGGFAWGEPVGLVLKDASGQEGHASGVLVPFPRRSGDDRGHTVEIRILDSDGLVFEVSFRGYEPGETVRFTSISGDEVLDHDMDIPDNLATVIMPAVVGQTRGDGLVRVVSKDGGEVEIAYRWGTDAFEAVTAQAWNEPGRK